MKEILKQITRANHDYGLIDNHDRVAVGFSGGMDSYALAVGLDLYKKRSKLEFELAFFYMDMNFDDMNIQPAVQFLETLGYPLHIIPTEINDILKQHPQKHTTYSCSICSRLKKGYFINHIKPLGFNKVAFAHHGDDALETLFLNMIYGGRIATFEPCMYLSKQDITFIRPLVYTFKHQIEANQQQMQWPIIKSTCPNNLSTQRNRMRPIIQHMVNHYPGARHNLLKSIYNDAHVDLWVPLKEKKENEKP